MLKKLSCTYFLVASLLLSTSAAHAGFGVGILGSLQKDTWTASGGSLTSVDSPKNTTRYGVLAWFPLLPTLSVRTGYLMETQATTTNTTLSTTSATLTNSIIPLNLQFDLPLTGLYAFGGALFVTNQSIDPSSASKNSNDTRTNLGLGYDLLGLPLMSLSTELEYQRGSNNVSPTSGYDIKVSALSLNLVFKVGF